MAARQHRVDVAHVKDGRPASGRAVLVDRVWPRGQRKDEAPWDEWLKAVAPSTELRTWYAHDPDKREEFVRRYREELSDEERADALAHLRELHRAGPLTLMTATRDLELSQAQVLADLLGRR
ncbi:MAG TPA: DUF488 family protein [Segeticoccus sp.]|nr:DUF488 family protein [Segeticoccus sp.]